MINDSDMLKRTEDAYSFSRYGEEAWMNAIRLLAPLYTEEEIVWILYSKYMRWAADTFSKPVNCTEVDGDRECDERCTGDEIIMYHDKWGINIERDDDGNPYMD